MESGKSLIKASDNYCSLNILYRVIFILLILGPPCCRVEYQSRPSVSGASSFKRLLLTLPPRVHSVYYRDEIGNISSSHLRGDSYKVGLDLALLFPQRGFIDINFVI